jgi:hypothetical protein
MFIIVGNNKQTQQVRIFDTTDNTSGWYSYDFMNKGINLGITVRGINSEGIIRCQQVNILKELEESISDLVHSYRVYNTSELLLEYLQAYGLADSMSDIVLNDTTLRIKRLGKDIKLKTYAMSDEAIKKAELDNLNDYGAQMQEYYNSEEFKESRRRAAIDDEANRLFQEYGYYKPDDEDDAEVWEEYYENCQKVEAEAVTNLKKNRATLTKR